MTVRRDSPLVSVVVATRNRQQLAELAIRSVLVQTYDAIEVCVVDDASDPPFELPDDIRADSRVRLVRLDEHQGSSVARNTGIERSAGPYIAFLDDDDEWHPTKLERQVPLLAEAPASAGAVECGYEMYADGRLLFRYVPLPKPELKAMVLARPTLQISTLLMRRTVFDAIGLFDPVLHRTEDWELWLRFADRFAVASMPEVLVSRRLNVLPIDQVVYWSDVMFERLRPRIDALPAASRRRIRAWHAFDKGVRLTAAGSTASGVRSMLAGWRMHPASLRYLLRALIAPAPLLANVALGSARFLRRAERRLRGRDPFARRW